MWLNYLMVLVALEVTVLTFVRGVEDCSDLVARTNAGLIRGVCQISEENNKFVSFYGVPYAEQPLGEWRFKELRPLKPYDFIYNATKEGPVCPQNTTSYKGALNMDNMSEACIHANIYVPLRAFPGRKGCVTGRGLPVLVYIHGGSWVSGSSGTGLYGPEYLIDRNVIIITFQYRLQAIGFLSLNSARIPGNNGMRDIITLLRWVKANVKYWGGDPDNVTLGGESAGGTMAHLLTLSKAAAGLFKRAMVLSGEGIRSFYSASPTNANNVADIFLSAINITSTNAEEIYQQLLKKSTNEILQAATFVKHQYYEDILSSFNPVVETQFSQTRVLEDDPEILVRRGRGKEIPLLIGFTNNESQTMKGGIIETNFSKVLMENPNYILSPDLDFKTDEATARRLGEIVENKYFGREPSIEKILNTFTKIYYQYPAIKLAQLRSKIGGAPVYLREFSYDPDFSTIKYIRNITYRGAAHIDDVTFIFKSNSMNGKKGFTPRSYRDRQMIKQMTGYVKNFMTCSKPICDKNSESLWPPVAPNQEVVYEEIKTPGKFVPVTLTKAFKDTVLLFDELYKRVLK